MAHGRARAVCNPGRGCGVYLSRCLLLFLRWRAYHFVEGFQRAEGSRTEDIHALVIALLNANIVPRQPRNYLYHAYLVYMEANGYRNVLSLKMFGLGLPMMLKEYGLSYEKRHTRHGTQTNLTLKEESDGDWLPKCDEPAAK